MLALMVAFLFIILILLGNVHTHSNCTVKLDPNRIRACCEWLANNSAELLGYLEKLEAHHGNLLLDNLLPSLYMFKSVALFELRQLRAAGEVLNEAVQRNPLELRAWANLVDLRTLVDGIGDKNEASDMVEKLSGEANIARRLKRVMWHEYEVNMHRQETMILLCLEKQSKSFCEDSSVSIGAEFTTVNGSSRNTIQKYLARSFQVPGRSKVMTTGEPLIGPTSRGLLRIGFLLALVDGGPVNALSQALIRHLDRTRCSVVAYVMITSNPISADWVGQYLQRFDRVYSLNGMNDSQSAELISHHEIDILIDPNGYNFLSGMQIMKYRPARLQMNFLGDPLSAGATFIDYYVGDPRANPPDITSDHFMEKLIYLPACYLTNSHYETTPDLLIRPRQNKSTLMLLTPTGAEQALPTFSCTREACADITQSVLIGAFHSYMKFDPVLFQVWMNILQRVPVASIVFIANPGDALAMQNLVIQARFYGIHPRRVLFLSLTQWFAHVHFKSALDLYVDTVHKNGHTTTLDAAWAGLPTVALGAQRSAPRRSAESVLHHLAASGGGRSGGTAGGQSSAPAPGVVYSLREYEEVVVRLIATRRGRARLTAWRTYTERARLHGNLFDARHFAGAFLRSMEAAHEFERLKQLLVLKGENMSAFHIYHPTE